MTAEHEPCECGATAWNISATLIACKSCGRLWGRCNEQWVFDPDSEPSSPPTAQPPPVLDLDALAEAERAMTANLAVEAGSVPIGDTGDYDAYIHIVDRDGRVVVIMNSPEADRSLALARGIVALRNAAPHLIAEARAAVALRAEVAAYSRLTTDVTLAINAALGNDARLGAEIHHEVTRIVGALRQELAACAEKLAEAKRLWRDGLRDDRISPALAAALEAL